MRPPVPMVGRRSGGQVRDRAMTNLVQMPLRRTAALLVAAVLGGAAVPPARTAPLVPAGPGWLLSTTDPANQAPPFLGNGYLGRRVPAAGTGDAVGPVPTETQLAGFFAQGPGNVQQRADIPTWSTLALSDGSGVFGQLPAGTVGCTGCPPAGTPSATSAPWQGTVLAYRQTLDLYRDTLTTEARWVSPGGRRTDLVYDVIV